MHTGQWIIAGLLAVQCGCCAVTMTCPTQPEWGPRGCGAPTSGALATHEVAWQDGDAHPMLAQTAIPASGHLEGPVPWFGDARARWQGRAHQARAWIKEKVHPPKEPPHPRFHPVPVRPVFAPTEATLQESPARYGEFGASHVVLEPKPDPSE
jgi:hypothetical protein